MNYNFLTTLHTLHAGMGSHKNYIQKCMFHRSNANVLVFLQILSTDYTNTLLSPQDLA